MSMDGMHLGDDASILAAVSNLDGTVHVTNRNGTFPLLHAHLNQTPDLRYDTYEVVPVTS